MISFRAVSFQSMYVCMYIFNNTDFENLAMQITTRQCTETPNIRTISIAVVHLHIELYHDWQLYGRKKIKL